MADEKSSQQGDAAGASGGKTKAELHSFTPENRAGIIDPSSPNTAITSPSTQAIENHAESNDPE